MQSIRATRRFPCANVSNSTPCQAEGKLVCTACRLLLYCSQSCQKAHWSDHKKDCKSPYMKNDWIPSWHVENCAPSFVNNNGLPYETFGTKKYLWGNMPAIDVLALKNNEGLDYEKELNLLFPASGDFRNIVKTVAELPLSYKKQLTITLNDRDLDIVARNAIMLILLLAVDDTEAAVDCVLHIWYSAQITKAHLDLLNTSVRPVIQEMCTKIVGKADGKLLGKTWCFGNRTIRIVLTKQAWNATLLYLDLPDGLSSQRAHNVRVAITLAPQRKDNLERYLFEIPPAQRVCSLKFRKDGILLPFGYSRDAHSIPNPTFFQDPDSWLLMDSADPISEWVFKDVLNTFAGGAINDIYGKLYFHVKDALTSFRHCSQSLSISFNLFQLDARELKDHLSVGTFARIEVSNICDAAYLGPAPTVGIFTPFLQKHTINPHATLITLFMNAIEEEFKNCGDEKNIQVIGQEIARIEKYLPYRPPSGEYDPYLMKALGARAWVRDVDRYLEKYMEWSKFWLIGQLAKAKVKRCNTIVDKWPSRLKLRPGQSGAQEEFDLAVASTMNGTECYLEWHRE